MPSSASTRGEDGAVTIRWSVADLMILVNEYLDLPVDYNDLCKIRQNNPGAFADLLDAVRTNPGDEQVLEAWKANLTPADRELFERDWDAAYKIVEDDLVTKMQAAAGKQRRAGPEEGAACEGLVGVPLSRFYNPTDAGNGERLAARFGGVIRYCHPWKKWLYFDGRRWSYDRVGLVGHCAKVTVRAIATEELNLVDDEARGCLRMWARKSEDAKALSSLVKLAASEPGIAILPETLDADPWLLNTRNCTLDLRRDASRRARPHNQADLITKLAPVTYDPDAQCPHWESTMRLVFDNNDKLIEYWRQLCGIALTGSVDEEILPILYGTGSNGKSTILLTMLGLLGPDYAMPAPHNMLMMRSHEPHPTELASLHGKRLVAAVETGEGVRINEVLIKLLTGKDTLKVRRMREDYWDMKPTHKVWLATNHRPEIRGIDHAIWRRVREVPFTVAISEDRAIKNMDQILASEYSGILNWCIKGCMDWQEAAKLATPQVVADATAEYKQDQDLLVQFLGDVCVLAGEKTMKGYNERPPLGKIAIKTQSSKLHSKMVRWLAENYPNETMPNHKFGKNMAEHGYTIRADSTDRTKWYIGVGLKHDSSTPVPGPDGTERPNPEHTE